jgi:hypothetical protein
VVCDHDDHGDKDCKPVKCGHDHEKHPKAVACDHDHDKDRKPVKTCFDVGALEHLFACDDLCRSIMFC